MNGVAIRSSSGLSQIQLHKSQEQYQKSIFYIKIPKFVVVHDKIGAPWYVLKLESNTICKMNWNDSFPTFSNFPKIPKKSLKRVQGSNLGTKYIKMRALLKPQIRLLPHKRTKNYQAMLF